MVTHVGEWLVSSGSAISPMEGGVAPLLQILGRSYLVTYSDQIWYGDQTR